MMTSLYKVCLEFLGDVNDKISLHIMGTIIDYVAAVVTYNYIHTLYLNSNYKSSSIELISSRKKCHK